MENEKTNYARKFENLSREQYEAIYNWLKGMEGEVKISEGYHYLTFGDTEYHARIDPEKRTVELTDKVELDVGELLGHIIKIHKK